MGAEGGAVEEGVAEAIVDKGNFGWLFSCLFLFSSFLSSLDDGRRGGGGEGRRGRAGGGGDLEGGEDVEGHWLLGNRKGR